MCVQCGVCAPKAVSTPNRIVKSRVRYICSSIIAVDVAVAVAVFGKCEIMEYFCTRRYYCDVCNKNKFPIVCISSQTQAQTKDLASDMMLWYEYIRKLCERMVHCFILSHGWAKHTFIRQAMCMYKHTLINFWRMEKHVRGIIISVPAGKRIPVSTQSVCFACTTHSQSFQLGALVLACHGRVNDIPSSSSSSTQCV